MREPVAGLKEGPDSMERKHRELGSEHGEEDGVDLGQQALFVLPQVSDGMGRHSDGMSSSEVPVLAPAGNS